MKLGALRISIIAFLFLIGSTAFSQGEKLGDNDSPTADSTVMMTGLFNGTNEINGTVGFGLSTIDTVDFFNIPDSAAWNLDTSFLGNLLLGDIDVFPSFPDYRIELRQYIGATRSTAILDTTIIIPTFQGASVVNIDRRNFYSIAITNVSGGAGIYGLDFLIVQGAPNGSGSLALPVEWLNFEATLVDQNVHLLWSTASEENNRGFYVERSADADTWEELGFVEGGGTTEEIRDYSFIDKAPSIGYNYYRIRQVDFNGDIDYSVIRETILDPGVFSDALKVFPNPTTDVLNISPFIGTYTLMDLQGRVLKKEQLNGTWTKIPVTAYPQGTYLLKLQAPNQDSQVLRFIKR